MPTDIERAESQARAQYEHIVAMMHRLEHAQECTSHSWLCDEITREDLLATDCDEGRDQYHDENEATERIQEDPLSVMVRSDWHNPGETLEAAEFEILLCTGGPAVRIRGELGEYSEPRRAWIEYQDWGTPWTQYFGTDSNILLSYCHQFYFGE